MKKFLPFTFLALAVLITACNKTDLIGPNAASTAAPSNSYQPTTAGSVWRYVNKVAGKADEQIMIRAVGSTSYINSKTYYAVTSASSVNGSATNYYFSNGVNYTIRGTGTVPGVVVELQFLDSSIPLGTKWTIKANDSGIIDGVAARFEGSTVEKDITKTIGTNTFTDVIHTTVNLQYNHGAAEGYETVATYDYYVAKSIGIIEVDSSVKGAVVATQTITSYDVK